MSRSVDNRIVEMTFDNKQFENGVQTSLNTLDKLNEALQFKNSDSGINSIASSLESLNNRFSTLGIIGAGVISRLTQEVMNDLLPILNTITGTIDKLTLNFQTLSVSFGKYEQMVSNQQTIMSAVAGKVKDELTGEVYAMEDVSEIIDRLRWYTDETSYNLDQMVNAIGDFTSSGIDLAESEQMILGIANACADAGISADKADTAMRGFSRAIGSGGLTLQVWNTMLKTSGLTNSERFKQSLLDAAEAEGTLIRVNGKLMTSDKRYEVTVANLTERLTDYGWANTNVLKKVLFGYSNTVSGIYELTQDGKIDLSIEAFTELSEAMEKQGKTLEDLGLDQQYDLASDAIRTLTEAYEELGLEVPKSLKAFTRAQEAVSLTQAIDATATAVRSQWARTFELIFGNYEEAKRLWTGVANSMWGVFAGGGDFRNDILSYWHDSSYERFSDGIVKAIENIENAAYSLRDRFQALFEVPKEFENLEEYLGSRLGKMTDRFSDWMNLIGAIDLYDFAKSWEKVPLVLEKTGKAFSYVSQEMFDFANLDTDYGIIQDFVEKFGSLEEVLRRFKIIDNIRKIFNGFISVLDIGRQIVSGFWRATEPLRDLLIQLAEKILDVSGVGAEWITNLAKTTKETDFFYKVFKKLVDIIMGVGVPAFNFLSNIFKTIKEFLSPLAGIFENAKNAVKEFFNSISDKNVERMDKLTDFFKNIGIFLEKVLSKIVSAAKKIHAAFKEIFDGISLKEIGELLNTGLLSGILYKIFNKTEGKKTSVSSSITGVIDQIKGVLSSLKDVLVAYQDSIKASTLLKIAIAIGILAVSLVQLTKVNPENLSTAVIGLGLLMEELYLMLKGMAKIDGPKSKKSVKGLISLAASILILSYALKNIGGMKWGEIFKGIVGLGLVMAELILASKYMERIRINPSGMIALAAAMLIFALDMKVIGGMDWEEIAKGAVGIGTVLLELAAFFGLMNSFGGGPVKVLATSVAITVMSAAMLVFAGVLKILGTLDADQIGRGLTAIGVGLLEFAVAALVMKDALPAAAAILLMSTAMVVLAGAIAALGLLKWETIAKGLITMAGALGIMVAAAYLLKGSEITILAFGAALTLAGIGVAAFAIGIEALAIALSTGSVIIVEAIALIIATIADLIPTIIEKIGEGIIGVIKLIGDSASAIVEAVVQIVSALLIAINDLIPLIIDTGINIILSLLKGIADNIYQIVVLAGKIVTEFIDGIAEILPQVIDSGINLIVSFIDGMATAIYEHTDDILEAVGRMMASIAYFVITALDNLLSELPIVGGKIHEKLDDIKSDLEQTLSKSEGEKIGSNITSGIKSGIEKNESSAIKAAGSMATKALKAAKDMLGIQSPSKAFAEVGKYADEGLAQGLYNFTSRVTDASASVAESALETIQNPMKSIADLVSDEVDLDPVITPVLDLSKIQNGARNIGSLFGTTSIAGIGSIGQFSGSTVNDTGGYSPTVNVTIYASEGQSSDDLYNTFTRRLNNDVRRRSLVWDH